VHGLAATLRGFPFDALPQHLIFDQGSNFNSVVIGTITFLTPANPSENTVMVGSLCE
jgi:hypothetical protein